MKAKAAVATVLKQEQVDYLMCFPDNALIDAAAALDIQPILARTERVAINIADGYTRLCNGQRIGVCALQYAGGIENAFAGAAQAYGDATPLLLLPSGYRRAEQGIPPNFDARAAYAPISKWTAQANAASRIPQLLQRAFTLLRSGKPGPVLLEIPTDVMDEEGGDIAYLPVRPRRSMADPQDVRELVDALLGARRPVIVAGQGLFYAEAWEELRELAELTQTPVMTTQNAKSVFPENHPLALGTGGHSRPASVDHFLARADFVLGLGTSFTRSTYTTPIPAGKRMAQVTNCAEDLNKDYAVSYGAIGDAKLVLQQMLDELRARRLRPQSYEGEPVAREIAAVKEAFLREWMPRLSSDESPISPYRLIWELMQTLDRQRSVVTHDAGNPRDQMTPFFEALVPHGYIGWGKTTQLGSGLGLTIGAKLAAPERLAVNVMGDAAFGMVGLDFETAVRLRIPILTIVMNNSLMGGYDKFLPVSTEKYGTRYLSGNFSRVADGLGGYTERVERVEDLGPALRRAIREVEVGRPTLLEVITREDSTLALGPGSHY